MRSTKRPRPPVHRYRSLLFPGMAVLAVLAFYAAFDAPPPEKGETARFEREGLCLEVTGGHGRGSAPADSGPERDLFVPYDTYYVSPGGFLTVVEAPEESGGAARWELRREAGEPLGLTGGVEPVELTEAFDSAFVFDRETGLTLLLFRVTGEDQKVWK